MKRKDSKLSDQMKRRVEEPVAPLMEYDGSTGTVISTGSTLLDLAISGGRVRGGGIPGGILVEIFGPYGCGKTVMLCEIAGAIQRQGGEIMFHDPEARLNKTFAAMFDLDIEAVEYRTPDTVPELFSSIREWEPKTLNKINGVIADSLAALSTDLEMNDKDAYGGRRAKEFSEQLRRTCRILPEKNFLIVCSNQVRQSFGDTWGPRYISPGGESIKHYPSLRLECSAPKKIKEKRKIKGNDVERVVGVETTVKVEKSTVWNPMGGAPVTILFDYGIDDIRANLKFIKQIKGESIYMVDARRLDKSMAEAIKIVEADGLEVGLKDEVIDLWEETERKFDSDRKVKER